MPQNLPDHPALRFADYSVFFPIHSICIKTIGPLLAASFGAAAIKAATDAYIRQENAIAQLDQRLKSTGATVGFTSKELQGMAASLQKVTTFGDEATIEMQGLLLTFTQIRGPIFQGAQEAILNVAQAMGTDLKSAAIQVGKALNDPKGQLSALSRSGIQFNDVQKEQIKLMQEAGDIAGAQTIILKELETQFGGAARAARDTLGGAITSLSNVMGDLGETIVGKGSEALGVVGGLNAMTSALSSLNEEISGIDVNALNLIMFALNPSSAVSGLVASSIVGSDLERAQGRGAVGGTITNSPAATQSTSAAGLSATERIYGYTQDEAADAHLQDFAMFQDAQLAKQVAEQSLMDWRKAEITGMADYEIFEAQRSANNIASLEQFKQQSQQATLNNAVGFLQVLAGESKVAAIAGIALQKGIAIASTITATAAGATLAFASQLIPGDPTSPIRGAAAAASVKAMGAINVALIAATGIAQAASVAGASSGSSSSGGSFGGGQITQPVEAIQAPQKSIVVQVVGNVIGEDAWVENNLVPALNAAMDRNVTLNIGATA